MKHAPMTILCIIGLLLLILPHQGVNCQNYAEYSIHINNDASQTLGQYHLLATSTGSVTPSFSGSGTISTVTFNVTGIGSTGLAFEDVELSELTADRTVNLVTPSTSVDPVNPIIPEFPITAIMGLLLVLATASVAISTKLLRNRTTY